MTVSEPLSRMIDALTVCAAFIVTAWQAPVPLQAPLQAASRDPVAGVAVNVTRVPEGKFAVQASRPCRTKCRRGCESLFRRHYRVLTVKSCVDAPPVVKLCVALVNVPLLRSRSALASNRWSTRSIH